MHGYEAPPVDVHQVDVQHLSLCCGRRCGLPKEQVVVRSWRAKEFGKRVDRALEAIGRSYMRDLNKKLLAMKFTIRILQYY